MNSQKTSQTTCCPFRSAMESAICTSFHNQYKHNFSKELRNTMETTLLDAIKHITVPHLTKGTVSAWYQYDDALTYFALAIEQTLFDHATEAKKKAEENVKEQAIKLGYATLVTTYSQTSNEDLYIPETEDLLASYINSRGLNKALYQKAQELFNRLFASNYYAELAKRHNTHKNKPLSPFFEQAQQDAFSTTLNLLSTDIATPIGNLSQSFPLYWKHILPELLRGIKILSQTDDNKKELQKIQNRVKTLFKLNTGATL